MSVEKYFSTLIFYYFKDNKYLKQQIKKER